MSKTNNAFSAQVLKNAQAENHKSDFGEGTLLFLNDKGIPIPKDKVSGADSVDKDKLIIVDASGSYKFITIAELKVLLGISS